jgi:hypothetical protein
LIQPGRYRFVAARSTVRVTAYAPGHRFVADGPGLEGIVELERDRIVSANVTFPLYRLDAHDALKNHELKKFLAFETQPIARGEILSATDLSSARIAIAVGGARMETLAAFRGEPPNVSARFQLSFTGLGYAPPKILFLKVKDGVDVELGGLIEPVA